MTMVDFIVRKWRHFLSSPGPCGRSTAFIYEDVSGLASSFSFRLPTCHLEVDVVSNNAVTELGNV